MLLIYDHKIIYYNPHCLLRLVEHRSELLSCRTKYISLKSPNSCFYFLIRFGLKIERMFFFRFLNNKFRKYTKKRRKKYTKSLLSPEIHLMKIKNQNKKTIEFTS